jgi:hypothetical protein
MRRGRGPRDAEPVISPIAVRSPACRSSFSDDWLRHARPGGPPSAAAPLGPLRCPHLGGDPPCAGWKPTPPSLPMVHCGAHATITPMVQWASCPLWGRDPEGDHPCAGWKPTPPSHPMVHCGAHATIGGAWVGVRRIWHRGAPACRHVGRPALLRSTRHGLVSRGDARIQLQGTLFFSFGPAQFFSCRELSSRVAGDREDGDVALFRPVEPEDPVCGRRLALGVCFKDLLTLRALE